MKDTQSLAKLLGHLPPKVFRTIVHEEFNAALPELNEKMVSVSRRLFHSLLSASEGWRGKLRFTPSPGLPGTLGKE